jgi:hypothetical protein
MADRWIYMVFSNPAPGKDAEFNRWYDEVHVPEVLAVDGMVSAQRLALFETESGRASGDLSPTNHRYGLLYELDRHPDEVMAEVQARVADGRIRMDDCLDLGSVEMTWWTPHGDKQLG